MKILKTAFPIPLCAFLAGCSVTRSIDLADPGQRELRGGQITVTVKDTITHGEEKGTIGLVPGHGADLSFRNLAISSATKAYRTDAIRFDGDTLRFNNRALPLSEVKAVERKSFSWGRTVALIPTVFVAWVAFAYTTVALGLAKMEDNPH